MRQVLLAAMAAVALSLPAMAQNQMQQPPSDQQQSSQNIAPSQLSHSQIRQVQQALDKKGFHAKRADGVWGPETEAALRSFQQKQKIEGSGQLNQQTLAALGVKWSGQGRSSTTGSGSNEMKSKPAGQMQPTNSNKSGGSPGKY